MSHIYLAGPITGLTWDDATDWRLAWAPTLQALGHTTASPMRGKDHLKDAGVLAGVFDEGKAAVMRDLWDIRRADIVIANFEGATRASIGTCCEIGYAFAFDTFVLTVMDPPSASVAAEIGHNPRHADPHDHIFITEMSSIVVPDMQAAYEWIKDMG